MKTNITQDGIAISVVTAPTSLWLQRVQVPTREIKSLWPEIDLRIGLGPLASLFPPLRRVFAGARASRPGEIDVRLESLDAFLKLKETVPSQLFRFREHGLRIVHKQAHQVETLRSHLVTIANALEVEIFEKLVPILQANGYNGWHFDSDKKFVVTHTSVPAAMFASVVFSSKYGVSIESVPHAIACLASIDSLIGGFSSGKFVRQSEQFSVGAYLEKFTVKAAAELNEGRAIPLESLRDIDPSHIPGNTTRLALREAQFLLTGRNDDQDLDWVKKQTFACPDMQIKRPGKYLFSAVALRYDNSSNDLKSGSLPTNQDTLPNVKHSDVFANTAASETPQKNIVLSSYVPYTWREQIVADIQPRIPWSNAGISIRQLQGIGLHFPALKTLLSGCRMIEEHEVPVVIDSIEDLLTSFSIPEEMTRLAGGEIPNAAICKELKKTHWDNFEKPYLAMFSVVSGTNRRRDVSSIFLKPDTNLRRPVVLAGKEHLVAFENTVHFLTALSELSKLEQWAKTNTSNLRPDKALSPMMHISNYWIQDRLSHLPDGNAVTIPLATLKNYKEGKKLLSRRSVEAAREALLLLTGEKRIEDIQMLRRCVFCDPDFKATVTGEELFKAIRPRDLNEYFHLRQKSIVTRKDISAQSDFTDKPPKLIQDLGNHGLTSLQSLSEGFRRNTYHENVITLNSIENVFSPKTPIPEFGLVKINGQVRLRWLDDHSAFDLFMEKSGKDLVLEALHKTAHLRPDYGKTYWHRDFVDKSPYVHINDLSVAPAELHNVVFADTQGRVLFNSFGHLLSVASELINFGHLSDSPLSSYVHETPLSVLSQCFQFEIPMSLSKSIGGTEPSFVAADLIALKQFRLASEIDIFSAERAVREAVRQLFGSFHEKYLKEIQGLTFTNPQRSLRIKGSRLLALLAEGKTQTNPFPRRDSSVTVVGTDDFIPWDKSQQPKPFMLHVAEKLPSLRLPLQGHFKLRSGDIPISLSALDSFYLRDSALAKSIPTRKTIDPDRPLSNQFTAMKLRTMARELQDFAQRVYRQLEKHYESHHQQNGVSEKLPPSLIFPAGSVFTDSKQNVIFRSAEHALAFISECMNLAYSFTYRGSFRLKPLEPHNPVTLRTGQHQSSDSFQITSLNKFVLPSSGETTNVNLSSLSELQANAIIEEALTLLTGEVNTEDLKWLKDISFTDPLLKQSIKAGDLLAKGSYQIDQVPAAIGINAPERTPWDTKKHIINKRVLALAELFPATKTFFSGYRTIRPDETAIIAKGPLEIFRGFGSPSKRFLDYLLGDSSDEYKPVAKEPGMFLHIRLCLQAMQEEFIKTVIPQLESRQMFDRGADPDIYFAMIKSLRTIEPISGLKVTVASPDGKVLFENMYHYLAFLSELRSIERLEVSGIVTAGEQSILEVINTRETLPLANLSFFMDEMEDAEKLLQSKFDKLEISLRLTALEGCERVSTISSRQASQALSEALVSLTGATRQADMKYISKRIFTDPSFLLQVSGHELIDVAGSLQIATPIPGSVSGLREAPEPALVNSSRKIKRTERRDLPFVALSLSPDEIRANSGLYAPRTPWKEQKITISPATRVLSDKFPAMKTLFSGFRQKADDEISIAVASPTHLLQNIGTTTKGLLSTLQSPATEHVRLDYKSQVFVENLRKLFNALNKEFLNTVIPKLFELGLCEADSVDNRKPLTALIRHLSTIQKATGQRLVICEATTGNVLFENIWHYITFLSEVSDITQIQASSDFEIDWPTLPVNQILSNLASPLFYMTSNEIGDIQEINRLISAPNEVAQCVALRLESLAYCASERDITPLRASDALVEAGYLLTGALRKSDRDYLESKTFTDPTFNLHVSGKTLVDIAWQDESKIAYQLYFEPTNVQLAAELPQQKIAKTPDEKREVLYNHLVEHLDIPLGTIFFAACSLGTIKETKKSFRTFKDLIIKDHTDFEPRSAREKPVKLFRDFVALHSANEADLKTSKIGEARLTEILKQLCFRIYDGDVTKIILELEEYRDNKENQLEDKQIAGKILAGIVPKLIKTMKAIASFKDPATIIFKPLIHQRETAINALHHEKPLVLGGAGTGKTEGLALTAESYFQANPEVPTGALWCTMSSLCADAVRRLQEQILGSSRIVRQLDLRTVASTAPAEFKSLLGQAQYWVASYDALRIIKEKKPDHFIILKDWIKSRVKVLDEMHKLDNVQSGRSKALQDLPSVATFGGTASPFQHRPERSSMLLHLILPERYPDVSSLEQQFKQEKTYARHLLHHHASVYSIEDVAKTFDPFGVRSAREQLADGLPRIPKMVIHVAPYDLSLRHSLIYTDAATNYPALAEARNLTKKRFGQELALRRLISNPELLGEGPPLAALQALKQIAIPALIRGEKVLVLGQHKNLLSFIHGDIELQQYGSMILSGDIPAPIRSGYIRDFEELPGAGIRLGQIDAVGTGSNFRGIDHIIYLERPHLISNLEQSMKRHVRLLVAGDERLAKEFAHVWFLDPRLAEAALEQVLEANRKRCLKRGTVYQAMLERDLARLEEFRHFTSRRLVASTATNKVSDLIDQVRATNKMLQSRRSSFELLSQHNLAEYYDRYRTTVKEAWRHTYLHSFVREQLGFLGKTPDTLKMAHLAGPEALGIPMYLSLGFLPEHVNTFEDDPKLQGFCRIQVSLQGCPFFEGKIETWAPRMQLDLLDIDTDGYMNESLCNMFADLQMADDAIIVKNSLCQRENDPAKALLALAENDRRTLDISLLRLVGARKTVSGSIEELLSHENQAKQFAEDAASFLSHKFTRTRKEIWEAALSGVLMGSPHIMALRQLTYHTPNGKPFLSTFARIKAINSAFSNADWVKKLRPVIFSKTPDAATGIEKMYSAAGRIHIVFAQDAEQSFSMNHLIELYDYYEQVLEQAGPIDLDKPLDQLSVA